MESLVGGNFTLRVDDGGGGPVRVAWLGHANERHPAVLLDPFFARLTEIGEKQGRSIELRFEDLEHFNSATIAVVVRFMRSCVERGVRLFMTFDPSKKWQKMTFDVLRRFERPDQLGIEAVEPTETGGETRGSR